jgi:hypothetical protein
MEQKFYLESFRRSAPNYTHQELQGLVVQMGAQLMIKDNIIQQLLKEKGL